MANRMDPGDHLYSRDGKHLVILLENPETRTMHVVSRVYDLIKDMGGDEDDHAIFLSQICNDDASFNDWCRDLPKWCPGVAKFVKLVGEEEEDKS